MTDKQQEDGGVPNTPVKQKKKTKRTSTRNKESSSGMSSSGRVSSSRRGRDSTTEGTPTAGDDPSARHRSRSRDKKTRRDSGMRRSSGIGMGGSARHPHTTAADGVNKSPVRIRKSKSSSDYIPPLTAAPAASAAGGGPSTPHATAKGTAVKKDRSRSRSPTRPSLPSTATTTTTEKGTAPRLPQRTVSESSDLQTALDAAKGKKKQKDNYEEASLGDFKKYSQQQKEKQQRFGANLAARRSGEIVEESLGSFTAFHKKYEQETLLGLHDDDDDIVAPYHAKKNQPQQQQQQQIQHEQSASLGTLMNPMKQYGGGGGGGAGGKPAVEESLGNFASFHQKYEEEKLLGLHNSNMSGAPPQPPAKEREPAIPEESMGDFVQMAQNKEKATTSPSSKTHNHNNHNNHHNKRSKGKHHHHHHKDLPASVSEEEETKEKEAATKQKETTTATSTSSSLPSSRVKNLGKRGGVGYRIMVDTPGGHFPTPMKIVKAIEYEDETDAEDESDEDEDDENENPVEEEQQKQQKKKKNQSSPAHCSAPETQWQRQSKSPTRAAQKQQQEQDNDELQNSGHLPMSPLEDVAPTTPKEKPQHNIRKKRHPRKATPEDGTKEKPASGPPKEETDENNHSEEDDDDDDDDQVAPLASSLSRWNNSPGGHSMRPPEREKSSHSHSTSTNSTVSSVTLESVLERGAMSIQTDACPSNANALQRQPVGRARGGLSSAALRRPSGAVQAGGTATLLKRPSIAPHNLGTKRGLLLRQQSEASMMSTGTSKSNDSSWQGNNDVPEDYQASFMQLNLMDLEKTQIQTNESVQQTQLPDELRSGVEDIGKSIHNQPSTSIAKTELEVIPEGKDPSAAASELLGMKTMLKHIKKVAPMRSRSFEFDRNMPKDMWNMMFAKSQKGALPGSQYVDDDSTEHEEEGNLQSTRSEELDTAGQQQKEKDDKGEAADGTSAGVTGALFSTIKRVTSSGPSAPAEKEKSGSKGKSLWTSAMKKVLPSMTSTEEEIDPSELENSKEATMDVSEKSLELEGILQELDQSLIIHSAVPDQGQGNEAPAHRRRSEDRDGSARGHRSGDRDGSARGHRSSDKDGSGRGPRSGTHLGNDAPKKGGTARSRAARAQHVHNRSLRDTLDFLSAEQDDDELPQLDAIKEEDPKKQKPRVRARRKVPNRTRSDESGVGRGGGQAKPKPSEGTRGAVGRTRSSQDVSPGRPGREATKKMHSSFSGLDPSDMPGGKSREKKDAPHRTKSKDGAGKDNPPGARSSRAEKGARGSTGRKQRPVRKKSTDDPQVSKAEASGHLRGVEIPENATETEVRELLGYH